MLSSPAQRMKESGALTRFATHRWGFLAFFGLLVSAMAIALWLRQSDSSSPITPDDDEDTELLASVVNPGYVGIQACAECHRQRVAEFQKTRHFMACMPAGSAAAPGFAAGRGLHRSRDPNLHFEMTRSGDDLLLTGIQTGPQGEQRQSYRVGLVYGAAGATDEMYHVWQGDRLFVHPVAWLFPAERWGHGADVIQARPTDARCLECHNTWVAHVPGAGNQYRREDMLLGVTCERCHGPGRDHVVHHRRHPKEAAHAILHPGNLSRERLMEVCTQCHSISFQRRRPPFTYRPGEPLEAYFRIAQNKHPEDDLVGNQVQYLRRSACFQKSDMTCVTCHDPHRPHDHKAASRSCFQCHTTAECTDQPRLPVAVRGDCAGCHMPPRIWMGAAFHTTDDQYVSVTLRSEHRIAVDHKAKQTVLLAWLRTQAGAESRAEADRLAAQLTESWLNEAEQHRSAGRLMGTIRALREALRVGPSGAARKRLQDAVARKAEFDRLLTAVDQIDPHRHGEMIDLLRKALEIKPDHALAHGKLGAMFAATGRRDEAVRHLEAVAQCDPNDAFGISMLAWLAHLDGRGDEAVALYAKADDIEPYSAELHWRWGTALVKLERWADAAQHFQQALAIAPKHAGGSQGLSEALRHQGKTAEALRHALRAARWTDYQRPDVLLTLADAYAAADRPDDARLTLEQALELAAASDVNLVLPIRDRLLKLR